MPDQAASNCSHRDQTEALVHDDLEGADKASAQLHLEHCEACRAYYRRETAGWFPRFPNYTIVERIGRGGFGEVYRAVHHAKERTEALKVLSEKTTLRVAYFQNEVHLVSRLRHPNIATLYEAHLRYPPLYFTMEYVEGEQLGAYLQRTDPSLDQRIELFKSVAEAIGYAHAQGVVHRDLKPQNVLIDAGGQARIVDFGIAKWLGREDDTGDAEELPEREGAVGTYGYIAPEQVRGDEVDRRADIYGLGVLLFHMITSEPPKVVRHPGRMAQILHQRQITRADDLAAIIRRCVEQAPDSRYQSCDELLRDVENYLQGRAIQARENQTLGYRAARIATWVLCHQSAAVQVGIVCVVAAVLSVALFKLRVAWYLPGARTGQTTLVTFAPCTYEAIHAGKLGADIPGLDPARIKSYRLLHGRLLEAISAGQPLVVAWDFYAPDCQPDYDNALIRGIRSVGAPVVIGAKELDVNGEPRVCPALREAAHSVAALISPPPKTDTEYEASLCMRRGFSPWVPALAVAAFAAARHSDCSVHLYDTEDTLELRYSLCNVPPNKSRWLREIDVIPVSEVGAKKPFTIPSLTNTPGLDIQKDDRFLIGRFRISDYRIPLGRTYTVEQVLGATPEQRRRWFAGRPVVVGKLVPGEDEHVLPNGARIFGTELHALVLDSLLADAGYVELKRPWTMLRMALWCMLAAVLTRQLPIPRRVRMPRLAVLMGLVFCCGVVTAVYSARRVTTPWMVELALAMSALLMVGGPVLVARAFRERRFQIAPPPEVSDTATTVSGTLALTTGNLAPASSSGAPAADVAKRDDSSDRAVDQAFRVGTPGATPEAAASPTPDEPVAQSSDERPDTEGHDGSRTDRPE
ncbi:MAG: protein kinase [Phycisphaerae bacterium]|nr:protein kinase [Phycisphaerae bacterium]